MERVALRGIANNPRRRCSFVTTVLAWGTTWFVILGQLGVVHPVVSVGWRFLLASLIVFGICIARADRLVLTLSEHAFCVLLGLFLFCLNYGLFYTASLSLTTGLISIVFSTMVFWNALGARLFLGQPLDQRSLLGGVVGVFGLLILFAQNYSRLIGKARIHWRYFLFARNALCELR